MLSGQAISGTGIAAEQVDRLVGADDGVAVGRPRLPEPARRRQDAVRVDGDRSSASPRRRRAVDVRVDPDRASAGGAAEPVHRLDLGVAGVQPDCGQDRAGSADRLGIARRVVRTRSRRRRGSGAGRADGAVRVLRPRAGPGTRRRRLARTATGRPGRSRRAAPVPVVGNRVTGAHLRRLHAQGVGRVAPTSASYRAEPVHACAVRARRAASPRPTTRPCPDAIARGEVGRSRPRADAQQRGRPSRARSRRHAAGRRYRPPARARQRPRRAVRPRRTVWLVMPPPRVAGAVDRLVRVRGAVVGCRAADQSP